MENIDTSKAWLSSLHVYISINGEMTSEIELNERTDTFFTQEEFTSCVKKMLNELYAIAKLKFNNEEK